MPAETIRTIHPCIRDIFRLDRIGDLGDIGGVVTSSDETLVFVQSVDQIPQVSDRLLVCKGRRQKKKN